MPPYGEQQGVTRRDIIKGTGGSIGVGLLAGCAGDGDSGDGSSGDGQSSDGGSGGNGEKPELTIWSFGPHAWYAETLAEKYDKANVTVESKPGGKINQQLTQAVQAGSNVPDLSVVRKRINQQYQKQEQLVDVSDIVEKYEDDMFAVAKTTTKWADPWRILVQDAGPAAMYYNVDVFEKAGLPTDPDEVESYIETWDDYISAGQEVEEATGSKMLNLPGSDQAGQLPHYICKQTCGWWYNENDEFQWDQQKNIDGYKIVEDLKDISTRYPRQAPRTAEAFRNEEMATWPIAAWGKFWFQSNLPEMSGKWRMCRLPRFKDSDRAANMGNSAMGIPVALPDEKKDIAKDFGEYMQFSDDAWEQKLNEGLFPSIDKPDHPMREQEDPYFGGQKRIKMLIEIAADCPIIYGAPNFRVFELFTDANTRIVQDDESPEDVLPDINRQMEAELSDANRTPPVDWSDEYPDRCS